MPAFAGMTEFRTSYESVNIHYSIFDIRFFRVSFPIKLVAPAACGSADT